MTAVLTEKDALHFCCKHGPVATVDGGDGPCCGVCNDDPACIALYEKMTGSKITSSVLPERKTCTFKELAEHVRKLNELMKDPHPGLISWSECYAEHMQAISDYWERN